MSLGGNLLWGKCHLSGSHIKDSGCFDWVVVNQRELKYDTRQRTVVTNYGNLIRFLTLDSLESKGIDHGNHGRVPSLL